MLNNRIYLSLGSNQGNRLSHLRNGLSLLIEGGLNVTQESIVLETDAILPENAPESWNIPYLNVLVCGSTNQTHSEFLVTIKTIEVECGRELSAPVWSPRPLDIDILLWDDKIIESDELNIPHKQILARKFLVHLFAMLNPYYVWKLQGTEYFGMNFGEIAHKMRAHNSFKRSFVLNPKLVAIANITPDSFSDGGLYLDSERAAQRIIDLSESGAYAIDIGGQSTRPGAVMVGAREELQRLEPVLARLQKYQEAGYNLTISIDSFLSEVITKAVSEYSITWINDQKSMLDEKTLRFCAASNCSIVVMHSLSVPPTHDNCIEFNTEPIDTILVWANMIIKRLESCGFSREKIIIDPGIGFGKSIYQNMILLRTLPKLKQLGCKILIGHSRKSYMTAFTNSPASNRDIETIAVSSRLRDLNIDYLRVHDVSNHQRFFVAQKSVFE